MNQKTTSSIVKDAILFCIALGIALVIYSIDVNVPNSIGIGSIYCMVILYSWILSGKYTSIYLGFICTILIITAMVKGSDSLSGGRMEGLNSFISIIVVWICVALVSATKSGYEGLEKVMDSLEDKVRERTRDLNKSRKKLEVSEKVYRYLYENANEMHANVQLNSNHIIRCNDTLCKKLGYSKDEILGSPVDLLHHVASKSNLDIALQSFRDKGSVKNAELVLRTKSGKKIDVILNASSARNDQGEITYSRFSWTDISELKKIEDERIAYAQSLEMKNKELEQFAFIASHDLQEPLRTVSSFSALLTDEYYEKLDQTGKDSLNFIGEATTRMRNLVKGLLDYSRIGKDAAKSKIKIAEVLSDLEQDLSLKIAETNTTINYKKLPDSVIGYKAELRQLFQNLIVNAMKFSRPGINPIITISAAQKKGGILFCIEDNGIGVPKEHQEKIFKIFKRLHIRDEYEGTGIGLANCQKIVDLHGGKMWIESEPGKGSKFFFTLSNKL
jgi:PAS domain S-box-containing protein